LVEEEGKKLPVGLQFLGKAMDETRLLGIADAFERAGSQEVLTALPKN
jgi:Asp-tRNA(Asn)/Glu-tRNA(Gln) amidotransferase A subunit family amidase